VKQAKLGDLDVGPIGLATMGMSFTYTGRHHNEAQMGLIER
jgi:hypothetical protein